MNDGINLFISLLWMRVNHVRILKGISKDRLGSYALEDMINP